MSLIDALLTFEKKPDKATAHVLVSKSGTYETLERKGKRSPAPVVYLTPALERINCKGERKPSLALVGPGSVYLSGVYLPNPERPEIGFGDVRETEDALLVHRQGDRLELFVCKGKLSVVNQVFALLADGDPDLLAEIEEHRRRAEDSLTNKGDSADSFCPSSVGV